VFRTRGLFTGLWLSSMQAGLKNADQSIKAFPETGLTEDLKFDVPTYPGAPHGLTATLQDSYAVLSACRSDLAEEAAQLEMTTAGCGRLAETLAVRVGRSSREQGGVPVRWLGDGVMVHFREPAGAVLSALELVEQLPEAAHPEEVGLGPAGWRLETPFRFYLLKAAEHRRLSAC
jgi:hypothetical protein